MADQAPIPLSERALILELADVLLQCDAPSRIKTRAVMAVNSARKLIDADSATWSRTAEQPRVICDTSILAAGFEAPAARRDHAKNAYENTGRLLVDLYHASLEAAAVERLLYAPLLAQARSLYAQLEAITEAITATPKP